MYAAHKRLVISTPYYIPDDAMQAGLCASARRGVETIIIFPARNDSWIVGMASHSFELNYENNIMLCDPALTAAVHKRQENYIINSSSLKLEMVESWSWYHKLANNTIAIFGPVL